MSMFHSLQSRVLLLPICVVFVAMISGCSSKDTPSEEGTVPEMQQEETDIVADVEVKSVALPASAVSGQDLIKEHLAPLIAKKRLGGRLFFDTRLSNPGANLATSCATCHVPPFMSNGKQNYSDSTPFSVIPANSTGGKLETIRNTPTLQDSKLHDSLNADGRYADLDALVNAKLISLHLGWEEDQAAQALNEIHALLLNDQGEDVFANGTYIEEFQAAMDVNLEALSQEDAIQQVVEALKAYMRSIQTTNTSSYDSLTFLNRFNEGLGDETDTPEALSGRIYGRIANEEGRVQIRFSNIFNEDAYQGYKTFIRVEPTFSSSMDGLQENLGNCVACHVPPRFSDNKFHNTGTAQTSYDAAHGEGAFTALNPEDAAFGRVDPGDPSKVDLGRYNVSPSEETVGAFRTPGLRNIEHSAPYNHDGQMATLEDVIRHKIKISEMAKAGTLRNPDPAYLTMNISEKDIPALAAFMRTLNEVPVEDYRDYRIQDVRIRQDQMEDATYEN